MRLSDTIYKMMNDARQRVIETMRERDIKLVNIVMTQEEYAKENGYNDTEDAEDDYNDYRNNEAPYVIFFNKWGNGIDYAALSVELEDGEHPKFKLNCYNSENGSDWFYDYDLTQLSMVNVYERMLEELEIKDEPEKVYVFTAEHAWDGNVEDIVVKTFRTRKAAQEFMHKFIHEPVDGESIADYVKRKDWEVEMDEPDLYRAYDDGYYSTDHVEITITECNME